MNENLIEWIKHPLVGFAILCVIYSILFVITSVIVDKAWFEDQTGKYIKSLFKLKNRRR